MATITKEMWERVRQHVIQAQLELLVMNDDGTEVTRLSGVINGGSMSIDSGSAIRRTSSFSLTPTQEVLNISEESLIWLNKKVKASIGILNQRQRTGWTFHNGYQYIGDYMFFNLGTFIYNSINATFDSANNVLSIELSDLASHLDGTTNGQLGGALSHVYQAYEEDPETGEPLSYTSIKKALEDVLKSAHVERYHIEDIGEYYAMEEHNPDYQRYRAMHPLWNMIPYDLEFSAGASVWDVINELVTLYPNYDAAYDSDGVFMVGMIPSEYTEENDFYYEDYMDMVISEQDSTDLTKVRNICEVWGQSLDADYYSEKVGKGATEKYLVNVLLVDGVWHLQTEITFSGPDNDDDCKETTDDIIYENISFDKSYHGMRFVYDSYNGFECIALESMNVSEPHLGNVSAGDTITTCAYGVLLQIRATETISSSLAPPHSSTGRFVIPLQDFKSYRNGMRIGVVFTPTGGGYAFGDYMQINDLEPFPIMDASTHQTLEANILNYDDIHVFQLVKIKDGDDYTYQWYYVGVSQSHALDVLTDGTVGEPMIYIDPVTGQQIMVDQYSKEYFQCYYNCRTVSLTLCPDSPYTVQKLGERLDFKSEGEFNNITSNELALERAQYENWKNSRLTDNITITTKLMPFAEPYQKIDYKKHGSKIKNDYVIQSVSHDFENGTTTIQMYTFYSLYKRQPGECDKMTYKYMGGFTNGDLYGDEDLT